MGPDDESPEVFPDDHAAPPYGPWPQPSTRPPLARRAIAAAALVAVGVGGGFGLSRITANQADATHGSATLGRGQGLLPRGSIGFLPGVGGGRVQAQTTTGSNTSDGPTDAAAIARTADAGVVDITTAVTGGEDAGSGMVITSTGEVLTNNHVIDGANSISVRDVGNGRTYHATVVGYDHSQDVAVLQLTGASGLSTVTTATAEPSDGAAVVAIGNAGGTGGTPSYAGGAITGTGAAVTAHDEYGGASERLTGLLATDADVQAGDSGGPLVDTAGQVVGMDTAAVSTDGTGEFGSVSPTSGTRGYAIPITTAVDIAKAIEAGQSSSTVHIGATAKLGVYVAASGGDSGAVVAKTEAGSPAAAAGIARGDVITAVGAAPISTAGDLTALMTTLAPGQTVAVTYRTPAGVSRTTQATLTTGPPQ